MYMFSKITLNVPYLLVFCPFARLNLSWRQKFGWLRPKEGAAGLSSHLPGSKYIQISWFKFKLELFGMKQPPLPQPAAHQIEKPLSIHSRVRLLVRGDDERRRSVNNLELIQL